MFFLRFLRSAWQALNNSIDLGEEGCQRAVPERGMRMLARQFHATHECCASMSNVDSLTFNAGHQHADAPFGSAGSFMYSCALRGSAECNPPFVELPMFAIMLRAEALLTRAQRLGQPLSIICVLPDWRARGIASPAIHTAVSSPFRRALVELAPKQHVYKHGIQQVVTTEVISRNTSIMIWLQTDAAAKKWPFLKHHPDMVVEAFRPLSSISTSSS
jgi:GNAT superfamily N-acetyltransferase